MKGHTDCFHTQPERNDNSIHMKIPPFLTPGDTIGLTCPAGYQSLANVQDAIRTLQHWGFEVMLGKTIGSRSKNYFSAPDEERANELQAMLDDPGIQAILFGRGGYGVSRIIDRLDFTAFRKHPKWLVGFSDITLLHVHLQAQLGVASLHGPMAGAFRPGQIRKSHIQQLHKSLLGEPLAHSWTSTRHNRTGSGTGPLIGGNLTLLAHAIGTASDWPADGKILFLEDVGEYRYALDRLLMQLRRSGKLSRLKGLILGGFTELKDTERPLGLSLEQIVASATEGYTYPVAFRFPAGHGKEQMPLRLGAVHSLTVTRTGCRLSEM